jgi:hypothetical protein
VKSIVTSLLPSVTDVSVFAEAHDEQAKAPVNTTAAKRGNEEQGSSSYFSWASKIGSAFQSYRFGSQAGKTNNGDGT